MKKMLLNFLIFTAAVLVTQSVSCMSASTKTDYSILSKKLQDDIEQTTQAVFKGIEKTNSPAFQKLNNLLSDVKRKVLLKMDPTELFELDDLLESLRKKYESGNSDLATQAIFYDNKGLDTLGAIQEAARDMVAKKLGLATKQVIEKYPDKDFIKALKKINFEEKLPGIFSAMGQQLAQKLPSLLKAETHVYGPNLLSLPGHNNNVFSIALNPKKRIVTINVHNAGIEVADMLDLNEFPAAHILALEDNPELPKDAQDGLLKLTATFAALLGMESLTFNSMFINKNNNKIKMIQDAGFKETAPGTLSLDLTQA